ncbi:hypothetical protein Hanom_Chr16g01484821 [Helianthus anomalus]
MLKSICKKGRRGLMSFSRHTQIRLKRESVTIQGHTECQRGYHIRRRTLSLPEYLCCSSMGFECSRVSVREMGGS